MEEVNTLLNVGSDEKHDFQWGRAKVIHISSDKKDVLMIDVVRYKNWSPYAAINSNEEFLGQNKNDKLLQELCRVDHLCSAKLYGYIEDKDARRCFVTHILSKHKKSWVNSVETHHATQKLFSTIVERCWASMFKWDSGIVSFAYSLQENKVQGKMTVSQQMKVNAVMETYAVSHVEAVLSIFSSTVF